MNAANEHARNIKSFNKKWLDQNLSGEVHYVYMLVCAETRFVGYFGVTNDPKGRARNHKWHATRKDSKRSEWLDHNPSPPEMVIMGAFPNRIVAELVERCLIRNFNEAGQILVNDYKYHNRRLHRRKDVQDDIPFWMASVGDEFV